MGFIANFRYRKISHSATVDDLVREIFRKSIHLCASLVALAASINLDATVIALSAVICVYSFCEYRRLAGKTIPLISGITAFASRKRDSGRFVLGPVTMALGVLLALVLFPPIAACVGIFALAFGDGIASLAGKLFGRIKIPHTGGKTVAGSMACFAAVAISSFAVLLDPVKALAVALLAMLIEVLPLKDYDNLLIPIAIGALVAFMI